MQLPTTKYHLFYKLHPALMYYANWRQKILPDQPGDPAEFYALEPEKRIKARDALHAQPCTEEDIRFICAKRRGQRRSTRGFVIEE